MPEKKKIENRKKILIKEFNNKNLNFKLVKYNDIFKEYKEKISDVLLLNFSTEILYDNFFKTFDKVDNEFKKILIIKSFKNMEQTVRFNTIFDLLKSSEIEKNLIFIIDVIDLSFNDFLRNYEFNNLVFEINELIKEIRLKNKKEITNIEKKFLQFYQKYIETMEYSKQSQFKIEMPKLPNTFIDPRINIFEYFNGALNIHFQDINNRNNLKIKEESISNEKYYLTKSLNKLNVKQLDRIHLETRLAYLNGFFFNNIYKGIDDIAKKVNSMIWDYSTTFKGNGISESDGILLRSYLSKACVNIFIIKNQVIAANYISLFFEKLGKIKYENSNKKSNEITYEEKLDLGLDFFLEKNDCIERNVFKSFLTKESFSFDLRSVLVHSIGVNVNIPCSLSLYFFSFLSKNYSQKKYYNSAYHVRDEEIKENISPQNYMLKKCKQNQNEWKHNLKQNDYTSNLSFYYSSGDEMSMFIHNIIDFEYYLFNNVKMPYTFNEEGFVHNKLLSKLIGEFKNQHNGQKNEVVSMLKKKLFFDHDSNGENGINIRNHIIHGEKLTQKELKIIKSFNLEYFYIKAYHLI